MQNAAQGPGTERRALRLIFAYEGSEIRLTDVLALDKATRPSDPIQEKGDRPRSGFWIELHGTGGRALYRQVMDNPVRFHAEVPDGKGGFTNRPIANPRGTFFVLVPDLADAEDVIIYSSPLTREVRPGPAEPVARFPLRGKRQGQEP